MAITNLAVLVALALVSLTLTSCGSGSRESEPTDTFVNKTTQPAPTQPAPTQPATPTNQTQSDTTVESTVLSTVLSTVQDSLPNREPTTLRVPKDYPTIQKGVDAAIPGDLVLIAPGTYREAVDVFTNDITVRGENRNTVILDGGDELENGIKVAADRVAVENLTIQRYTFNGLLFTKAYDDNVEDPTNHKLVNGYRASYVTTANNGQYGVYAFFARGGRMENVYASGHPDSGIYVGQCKPCDAVLTSITAERNAVGYEGTNASGNLFVVDSTWRNNRVGMTPNSQNMERLAPQGDVVLVNNMVESNNAADAPATAQGAFGVGIAVAGGNRNVVAKNTVRNNLAAGVIVTDLNGYQPEGNRIVENNIGDHGIDMVYADGKGSASLPARNNCFANNTFGTSQPANLETLMPCATPTSSDIATAPFRSPAPPPDVDYRAVPLPPAQPTMKDPMSTPTPVFDGIPTNDWYTS